MIQWKRNNFTIWKRNHRIYLCIFLKYLKRLPSLPTLFQLTLPIGISQNIVYFDNIINPNIVRTEQNPTNQMQQAYLHDYQKPLYTHALGSYIFSKSITILEEWYHFCVSS